MADIRLTRPAAGTTENVVCTPNALFVFDFPTDEGTLSRSGDNLVITFDDGGVIQLENFYTAYSSKDMPSFSVDGAQIAGEDFFMAMNEPDLMPAAGPGRAAGPGNGNRFHDFVNTALLDGLDRLGGLDVGWGDGEIAPDLDGGGGGNRGLVDFGVGLRPEVPGVLDPSIPVLDDPTWPDQPGWEQTTAGRDVLLVRESELDGQGSRSVDRGALLVDAPDGVVSIVIDGVTVFDGSLSGADYDARVHTDEGYLTHFTFDAATGRLGYDYVLVEATQEHGGAGRDGIAHNFHVTVTDSDGDTGNGLITVVIEDDVPQAEDDAASLDENTSVSGNVVLGTVTGGNGLLPDTGSGADDYGADSAALSGALVWNLEAWGSAPVRDDSAGTWTVETAYGTVTLHDNGDFLFEAKKNAGLDEGERKTLSFDYVIKDADGDTSDATLSIIVVGDTQPDVFFGTPGTDSGAVIVDEALLPGGNAGHGGGHAPEGDGSFTVNLKGEGGTVTLEHGGERVVLRLEADATTALPTGNAFLVVEGVPFEVTGAWRDPATGLWEVRYDYRLERGQDHPDPAATGADDALRGSISITVGDDTDDYASGELQVTVHDDGPEIVPVGDTGNMVSVSFGADSDTDAGSFLAVEAFSSVGERIVWSWQGGSGSDLNLLPSGERWTSADGNVLVRRDAGGNLVFSIRDNGESVDITVVATDADGDTDSETLHLTSPSISFGADGGTIVVDEAYLPEGSSNPDFGAGDAGSAGHGDGHAFAGSSSFRVDLHGREGSITLENGAGASLSLLENGVGQTSGSLEAGGVKITITGVELGADGLWTVSYTYELTGEQSHGDSSATGAGDALDSVIRVTVTDASGDRATGELQVTVHDDGPVLAGVADRTSDDALLNESREPLEVALQDFHAGADMGLAGGESTLTVQVTDDSGHARVWTFEVGGSARDGYVFTPDAANPDTDLQVTGDAGSGYRLVFVRPGTETAETPSYTFAVTVTDADGDSRTEETTVITKDRPDIFFDNGTPADSGEVQEAGVAGHFPPTGGNANTPVPGVDSASGEIVLRDTDTSGSESLVLSLGGSVTRTDNSLTHDNPDDAPSTVTEIVAPDLTVLADSGESLSLYLNAEGKLVQSLAPGEGYYGTLTLDFSGGMEGRWSFALHEGSDLVNELKEGERFEISLALKATDADGYVSDGASLHIVIEGTNDLPVFTSRPVSTGEIVVTDAEGGVPGVGTEVSGTLTATDPDADNGAGSETGNGLVFTVRALSGSSAGTVDGETFLPDDAHGNLLSAQTAFGTGEDARGAYTEITTTYGTFRVYEDGFYTYAARDTEQIGGNEYVAETFVVVVTDAHGSSSEQTVTITLRDENNATITGNSSISQSFREEGVAGDDPALGTNPNRPVSTSEGAPSPDNVLFHEPDLNDTLTLTIGETAIGLSQAGETDFAPAGLLGETTVVLGTAGESEVTLYLVANGDGTFSWAEKPAAGADLVGRLELVREANGDVAYDFTIDPGNLKPGSPADNSVFLDRLAQGDQVLIDLHLKAVGTGNKEAEGDLTLTVTGTNDLPVVDGTVRVVNGVESPVGAAGISLRTEMYGETGENVDAGGRVLAHDVDRDNGAGVSSGEETNGLLFTLTGMRSDAAGGFQSSVVAESGGTAGADGFTSIRTTYGTLEINPETGEFTYVMDNPGMDAAGLPNAIMQLGEGERVQETYTVRVTDSHGSYSETRITLTITGTNDRPVLETATGLEVHAAEDRVPDGDYHEGEDHATDQALASDPDVNDAPPTFLLVGQDASGAVTAFGQSVNIGANQLLRAIIEGDAVFSRASGAQGDDAEAALALLRAWLESEGENTVATLHITEEGVLSLELNQDSTFVDALNGEDTFTFSLSGTTGLHVAAKDSGGLFSEDLGDVTLVVHGRDDAYVVTSATSLQVKESGVYRGEITDDEGRVTVSGDLPTREGGTAYGEEREAAEGSFTIAGRDAGQVFFTVNGVRHAEHATTLVQGTGSSTIAFEGPDAPSVMYVAGDYGYYLVSLSSSMDAEGRRTFDYEYRLYSEETLDAGVVEALRAAEPGFDPAAAIAAVDALPQGANAQDSVDILASIGGSENRFTLSAHVSGSNDRPEILDVLEVTDPGDGVFALQEAEDLDALHASTASGMFFDAGEGMLHIQVACSNGEYDFTGRIRGEDPDLAQGSVTEGTAIVNYAFVLPEGSSQVWTINSEGDMATSEYGYIAIDTDGTFRLHINAEAVKSLGQDEALHLFEDLAVSCTDGLGASSLPVRLHGTLLGGDDAAVTTVRNPGMWEEALGDHDPSLPPSDPFTYAQGAGLVEDGKTGLKGSILVQDPDSSDTIAREVTVSLTVDGRAQTLTLHFDAEGLLEKIVGSDGTPLLAADGTPLTTLEGEHGTFSFVFRQDDDTTSEATLEYTYTAHDDEATRGPVDALNDGETYFGKYGTYLENVKVLFTSKHEADPDGEGTLSSATIAIDVHGANDAPVITQVQVGDAVYTDQGDLDNPEKGVAGGNVLWHGSASGTVGASDVDNPGAPQNGSGGDGGTRFLQFGFLLYRESPDSDPVVLFAKTGDLGETEYYRADAPDTPLENVNLGNITFSNHAVLSHGTIYVNDYGEYTYTRDPFFGDSGTDFVHITVRDEHGAMDSVKINFNLEGGSGTGKLPDAFISDVTMPVATEPGTDGGLVVAGEASGVVSSFDGNTDAMKLVVSCHYDAARGYVPVWQDTDGKWYETGTNTPVATGAVQKLTATLDPDTESWIFMDADGKPVEFSPTLDFRLSEKADPAESETAYSISTDYGTVYVDRATGELRFELDSRADALNAGETWNGGVYLWVNGTTTWVPLAIVGTGDPSVVTAEDIRVDLQGSDDARVDGEGSISIVDIDNSDGTDGARDDHTLILQKVDGEDLVVDAQTTVYVLKDGTGVRYTTTEPSGADLDACYGALTFTGDPGNFQPVFTAYADTDAGRRLRPGERLDFEFSLVVRDDSTAAKGEDEARYNDLTETKSSFTVTVVGRADRVDVKDDTLHVNEEGVPGTLVDGAFVPGAATGSLAVPGSVFKENFDGTSFSVSGVQGNVADFDSGTSVIAGKYGTLILHADGTYTYMIDHDRSQSLGEGDSFEELFTVKVENSAGASYAHVSVTVHGVNDLPAVTVTPALSVQEGVPDLSGATGKVDAQDVDANDTLTYGIAVTDGGDLVSTAYVIGVWEGDELTLSLSESLPADESLLVGTLTMDPQGQYAFELADTETVRAMNGGESQRLEVQIGATDGVGPAQTRPVTITIHGTNEAPVVEGQFTASEGTIVEQGDAGGRFDLTFTPAADDGDGYAVTDADRGDTLENLTYTLEKDGKYFTENEVVCSVKGREYTLELSLDPATGKITLSYGEDFRKMVNSLSEGETVTLDQLGSLVIKDNFGGVTNTELSLVIRGENDLVAVAPGTNVEMTLVDTGSDVAPLSGTAVFTFADADSPDGGAHSVLLPDEVAVTLPGDKSVVATVDAATGRLSFMQGTEEVILGTLRATLEEGASAEGGVTGRVSCVFTPGEAYLSSLGAGEDTILSVDLTVTDPGLPGGGAEQTVTITLEGANNAPVVHETLSSPLTEEGGLWKGCLVFSDADARDTHTVTLDGLTDSAGEPLRVETADLASGLTLEAYRDGTKIGDLTLAFTPGANNRENSLDLVLKPADDLNDLPVGENEIRFTVTAGDAEASDSMDFSLTLTNADDPTVITPDGENAFVMSDADTTDTLTPLIDNVAGTIEGLPGASLVFESATGTLGVRFTGLDGEPLEVRLGVLELQGDGDRRTCIFRPDPDAAAGLPEGASVAIETVSVSVTTTHADMTTVPDAATIDLPVTGMGVTGENTLEGYELGSMDLPLQGSVDNTTPFSLAGLVAGKKDAEGDSLSYVWTPKTGENRYILDAAGAFMLTEAGLLALATSVAAGEPLSVEIGYTVTDGLNSREGTLALNLDGSGVESVAVNGNLWLFGGDTADELVGGSGNDFLFGGTGDDTLSGGDGNDFLFGDSGTDPLGTIAGTLGVEQDAVTPETVDSLAAGDLERLGSAMEGSGDGGNDTLSGGEGQDVLFGGSGDDTLMGGAGNDFLFGGAGDDTLMGGEGDDYLDGGPGNDILLGGEGDDYLLGGPGNDYLDGGAGDNTLLGGAGHDIMVYNPDDYLVDGGDGLDVLLAERADLGGRTVENLLDGIDATDGGPMVSGFEIVITGDGIDSLGPVSLADLGISVDSEGGTVTLTGWTSGDDGLTRTVSGVDLTLDTNLMPDPGPSPDAAEGEAATQVFLLQHSQGA